MPALGSAPVGSTMDGGRRRSGMSVKALKRTLKKAGLKVSGKKSTLTRRAKKARLMGGAGEDGVEDTTAEPVMGARRHRRSRRSIGFPRLY